jgi:predicted HTH domain antitoxin
MTKTQKTLSLRVDADDYAFLSRLAAEKHENVSQAVRDLLEKGRLMLAIEEYQAGKASLGKAAEIAGLSISETIDLLTQHGVPANLEYDDYIQSLKHAQEVW